MASRCTLIHRAARGLPSAFSPVLLPCRSTHVFAKFKVTHMQRPVSINDAPYRQDKHRMADERFIYEVVQDTKEKPVKKIEVILTDTVEDIGVRGEVVSLDARRARRMVLLPRRGHYATPENILKFRGLSIHDDPSQYSSKDAKKTVEHLGGMLLTVSMNVHTPWVIQPWHVQVAFRKAGVHMPVEAIELPSEEITGPNLDYQEKQFYVIVTVNGRERVAVRCDLHHVSGAPKHRLPWSDLAHRFEPPVAILPSQQAFLSALFAQRPPRAPPAGPQLTPPQAEQEAA